MLSTDLPSLLQGSRSPILPRSRMTNQLIHGQSLQASFHMQQNLINKSRLSLIRSICLLSHSRFWFLVLNGTKLSSFPEKHSFLMKTSSNMSSLSCLAGTPQGIKLITVRLSLILPSIQMNPWGMNIPNLLRKSKSDLKLVRPRRRKAYTLFISDPINGYNTIILL